RPDLRSGSRPVTASTPLSAGLAPAARSPALDASFSAWLPRSRWCSPIPKGRSWRRSSRTAKRWRRARGSAKGSARVSFPRACDLAFARRAYAVSDRESFAAARELLRREGILGGSSTGTLLAAALRYCREQREAKHVVTLVCDSGNKYLSKMYNDFWMFDQGL